jgi:hypothetical protein
MIVLQNDMKSLTYKLVPYKETTLRVSGGMLALVNDTATTQTFTVYHTSTVPANMIGAAFKPGELRFESGKQNVVITLESGAVIERVTGVAGAFMLAQPRWYIDSSAGSNTMMVNFIRLGTLGMDVPILSQTGVGTVRMRHYQTQRGFYSYDPPEDIIISYSPDSGYDYSQAWRNYLTDSNGLAMVEGPTNTYTTREIGGKKISTIVVRYYDVMVEEL